MCLYFLRYEFRPKIQRHLITLVASQEIPVALQIITSMSEIFIALKHAINQSVLCNVMSLRQCMVVGDCYHHCLIACVLNWLHFFFGSNACEVVVGIWMLSPINLHCILSHSGESQLINTTLSDFNWGTTWCILTVVLHSRRALCGVVCLFACESN